MTREAYAAARTIAPNVHDYFARRLECARLLGSTRLAKVPEATTIEAVIDAAFWSSLRREEGYMPRISMAFLSPDESSQPLIFERPLPITPEILTRVAPAVERPGVHLGVWHDGSDLAVWGTTRDIPELCLVLEVAAPGLLVIKHHSGEEAGKFINVAVLEGDQIKVLDHHASGLPGDTVMVKLAVSMRAHGGGGCLLVVPADGPEIWRESIVQPMPYAVSPAFSQLAELSDDADEVTRAIDWVAGLTAVDGAAVMTSRFDLLGFGAKIARRRGASQVEQVMITEPVKASKPVLVHPEQLGGTRHFSAAQFVHDQHDGMALVASQDGRFTIFQWSAEQAMVHGNRVEALLL